jgi:hypothetical protein
MSDLGMDRDAMASRTRPICARRSAGEAALCGSPAFTTLFTTVRRYVDCSGCLAEIDRRFADRTRRGPVAPVGTAHVA